jgi:hypothetical protein
MPNLGIPTYWPYEAGSRPLHALPYEPDSDNLPQPEVIGPEILEDLEVALELLR